MKSACFIPIKANSERVKGKNFRLIGGEPLYKIIIDKVIAAAVFDGIFVDTNSEEIAAYCRGCQVNVIDRLPELAANTANGNDLLNYHFETHPDYDLYYQIFATAPLLRVSTIRSCVERLLNETHHDSVFTALKQNGFFWWNGQPVNYLPNLLPRSQDLVPVVEETTALYGITHASLKKFRCRIGGHPFVHFVDKTEAVDLNTEDDFYYANWLAEKVKTKPE